MKIALVFGSTGLVGGNLLRLLIKDEKYKKIRVFVRSSTSKIDPKIEVVQTDFTKLENIKSEIKGDDCFFCIGTTRKKTPNKQDYINTEYNLPITIGKICSDNNVQNFTYISSLGANPKTSNLYLKNKGMAEEELRKLNFKKFIVIRPSFLIGKRKEERIGEKIGIFAMRCISPILVGDLKKYKSINAEIVAKSMINISNSEIQSGVFEPPQVLEIGRE
jgi:uncharacterized protein YbjT (DUF2867 family)